MDKNAFLIDLCESDRTDYGRVPFSAQSEPQRVFSAVWDLESGVNNGGFEGYLLSSSGDTAVFAPWALREIGANACARIVERALRVASPEPLPEDQAERQKVLQDRGDELERLFEEEDDAFFVYPDDLTELLFAFVARHPEAFGTVPQA